MEPSENKTINDLWAEIQKLRTDICELKEYIVELRVEMKEGQTDSTDIDPFDEYENLDALDEETFFANIDTIISKRDYTFESMRDCNGVCRIIKKYVVPYCGEDVEVFKPYLNENNEEIVFQSRTEAENFINKLNRQKDYK